MAETPCCPCRGPGSSPWSGNSMPRAATKSWRPKLKVSPAAMKTRHRQINKKRNIKKRKTVDLCLGAVSCILVNSVILIQLGFLFLRFLSIWKMCFHMHLPSNLYAFFLPTSQAGASSQRWVGERMSCCIASPGGDCLVFGCMMVVLDSRCSLPGRSFLIILVCRVIIVNGC